MFIRTDASLWQKVEEQKTAVPSLYGAVDFRSLPERFTLAEDGERLPGLDHLETDILSDSALIETVAAYTLMGDRVGDAYAALMPRYGFRGLIDRLVTACEHGVAAVEDCPPELKAFIAEMEATPDWIDMALVEEGARIERNEFVHLVPFALRGAFLATFINRYSALPMTLTGNLTNSQAAKRVQETAAFFTLTVMPGALRREGPAFKAAAMVRLMHSMVRYNLLTREGAWDSRVYGIPIPQVDQMPAGQFGSVLIAAQALKQGRTHFNREERARIEIGRYRCFLLGLPKALLGETPREILRLMKARQSTLRASFDDATCGALIRGTLEADLPCDRTPAGLVDHRLERSFARAFFVSQFLNGDVARARQMGVSYTLLDRKLAAVAAVKIYSRLFLFDRLSRHPVTRTAADRYLVRRLDRLLHRYGRPEFATDGEAYRARRT